MGASFSSFTVSWLLNFTEYRHVLALLLFWAIYITCIDCIDIMSTPVYQLTIEQAHKEYNPLVDKIAAKHQQIWL